MNKRTVSKNAMIVTISGMLALSAGVAVAAKGDPLTPELAAKREMVRKQQDQQITHEKRKTAAEALKAERSKVYKAKHDAHRSTQGGNDFK